MANKSVVFDVVPSDDNSTMESHSGVFLQDHFKNEKNEVTMIGEHRMETPNHYPSSSFLSVCYYCNKKLEEGNDIYMYRGDKAFCSLACRAIEIMIDEEELEKSNYY